MAICNGELEQLFGLIGQMPALRKDLLSRAKKDMSAPKNRRWSSPENVTLQRHYCHYFWGGFTSLRRGGQRLSSTAGAVG
ncbi:unnamed protein product [Gadus morhua 'NCC']